MEDLERAQRCIGDAQRIVVLTGAGVSTDSGIPDFRGPQGVWTKDPGAEMLSDFATYCADETVRQRAWQHRVSSPMWHAHPNQCHEAIVELERQGRLDLCVTQNIDGLHLQAGTSANLLVEIHGNAREVVCLTCTTTSPMEETLDRVRAGEVDPRCECRPNGTVCGGILKSATISFGQGLDPDLLARAFDHARTCEVLIAAGTSLAVYPIAGMVEIASNSGADIVIANGEPTALDDLAEVCVRGPLAVTLPAMCRR